MNVSLRRRLLLCAAASAALNALALSGSAQTTGRVTQVRARRFEFAPTEIRLARGIPVTLELSTLDVVMGFNVPDFGIRSDILPDKTSRLQFTPDKVGKFPFHCDLFCGSGHEEMTGVIIVT